MFKIDQCTDLEELEIAQSKAYDDCVFFNDCSRCPRRIGYSESPLYASVSCELDALTKRIRELSE